MEMVKINIERGLTQQIIAAAIEVHRNLDPGLLESIYEECLCKELLSRGLSYERQKEIPVAYKGEHLAFHCRLDLLVERKVILEIKCAESIAKIHQAQLLTYMRVGHVRVELILNFNVPVLKQGIKRLVI